MKDSLRIHREDDKTLMLFRQDLPSFERIAITDFEDLIYLAEEKGLHRLGVFSYFLIEDGEAEIVINGIPKTIERNLLVCGIPGDTWEWNRMGHIKGKFIMFEAPFILAGLNGGFTLEPISNINSKGHYPYIPLSKHRYRRLIMLIEDMEEELSYSTVNYDLLRAELWQFIFMSEKEYVKNGNEGRESNAKDIIPTFINLVNTYHRQSHETGFYADKLNITPNYLNKLVRKDMGVNAHDYIVSRVMAEAKLLLRLTNVTVNQVSFQLGFEDPNYFSRLFKKFEGLSPGEFQKKGTL